MATGSWPSRMGKFCLRLTQLTGCLEEGCTDHQLSMELLLRDLVLDIPPKERFAHGHHYQRVTAL